MPPLATLLIYALAGTAMGLLALRTGIPAAPLAGALLGAGIVSMSGKLEIAAWPSGTRTVLEIGIGVVIGTSLTRASLEQLQLLWKPALLITITLVMTGLVIGLWTSRLLGIDPVVALLGAAPGGISGMSLVGTEFGVGAAVAALHAVRLITVLLVLPLVVKLLVPLGLGESGELAQKPWTCTGESIRWRRSTTSSSHGQDPYPLSVHAVPGGSLPEQPAAVERSRR